MPARRETELSLIEPLRGNALEKQRNAPSVVEVGEQRSVADEGDRRVREGVTRCISDVSEVLPSLPVVMRDGRGKWIPRAGTAGVIIPDREQVAGLGNPLDRGGRAGAQERGGLERRPRIAAV